MTSTKSTRTRRTAKADVADVLQVPEVPEPEVTETEATVTEVKPKAKTHRSTQYVKMVREEIARETEEPCSIEQAEAFVEKAVEAFWEKWQGAGHEEAVKAQPDLARHVMFSQPGGALRTEIGRLLGALITEGTWTPAAPKRKSPKRKAS